MARKECPPGHVEYASLMLARNASTLHSMIHPECVGVEPFKCKDHWHIGHQGNTKALCPPGVKPVYPRQKKRPKFLGKDRRKRRSEPS